jgi:hypothetical protein
LLRNGKGIDPDILPPRKFIPDRVQPAMVTATQWDGEFVAHLPPDGAGLGKAKVVSV